MNAIPLDRITAENGARAYVLDLSFFAYISLFTLLLLNPIRSYIPFITQMHASLTFRKKLTETYHISLEDKGSTVKERNLIFKEISFF